MTPRKMPPMSRRLIWLAAVIVVVPLFLVVGGVVLVSIGNSITPAGIIIHHSGFGDPSSDRMPNANDIDQIHQGRGFKIFYWGRYYHIGYHYVILRDGTVQTGRPEHCRGAHAEGYNEYIGICLVGNFSSKGAQVASQRSFEPTPAQLDALVNLTRQLQRQYNFRPENILRHVDVNHSTECPGDRFPFEQFLVSLSRQ